MTNINSFNQYIDYNKIESLEYTKFLKNYKFEYT